MKTKVLPQECVGEAKTSCYNKPIRQCLAHWEFLPGIVWKRLDKLLGNLGSVCLFCFLNSHFFFIFSFSPFPLSCYLSISSFLSFLFFSELRALCLLSTCSTTELCSEPQGSFLPSFSLLLGFRLLCLWIPMRGRNEKGPVVPLKALVVVTHTVLPLMFLW